MDGNKKFDATVSGIVSVVTSLCPVVFTAFNDFFTQFFLSGGIFLYDIYDFVILFLYFSPLIGIATGIHSIRGSVKVRKSGGKGVWAITLGIIGLIISLLMLAIFLLIFFGPHESPPMPNY